MSYEIISDKKTKCPCGNGCIRKIIEENDWFQRKETITIDCTYCRNKYVVKTNVVKSKPYHESVSYYLSSKTDEGASVVIEFD